MKTNTNFKNYLKKAKILDQDGKVRLWAWGGIVCSVVWILAYVYGGFPFWFLYPAVISLLGSVFTGLACDPSAYSCLAGFCSVSALGCFFSGFIFCTVFGVLVGFITESLSRVKFLQSNIQKYRGSFLTFGLLFILFIIFTIHEGAYEGIIYIWWFIPLLGPVFIFEYMKGKDRFKRILWTVVSLPLFYIFIILMGFSFYGI